MRKDSRESFDALLAGAGPVLALAPMQGVTDWPFLKLIAGYGGADVYVTEYFRVYATSRLQKDILKSVTENPTGRPIIAQMIGNDIPALVRTARELEQYPVAAVDLNLGCPAPVVYRKGAGGGLLREPARVDAILGALRDAVKRRFTVKTRIGFHSAEVFSELLPIFAKHSLDLVTVHARTVKEMYRSEVHYEFIARAVAALRCPVVANGNVYSAQKAAEVLRLTGARGLMIGRGVIRNPWLFRQIREHQRGEADLHAARDRGAGLRASALRGGLLTCRTGVRPGAEDEEVHELPRRRRRADRPVPAPDSPGQHDRGFIPCVPGVPGPRPAYAVGAIPARD